MRSSCSFVTTSDGFGIESSLERRWGLLVGNPTPDTVEVAAPDNS